MKNNKADDTKLRRAVRKQGYALKRDRKDGAYYIIDPYLNTIEAGLPHGMTADEVGTWCGHKVVEK